MVILPDNYAALPVWKLLRAVEDGCIGFDHRVIRAIAGRPDEVGDVVRFGLEPRREDGRDLVFEITALLRHLRTAEAIPFFLKRVAEDPDDVPDEVVEGLVELGEASLAPLLEVASQEGEPPLDALFALCSLGVRDDRIAALLLELARQDPSEGAFLLGVYGDPALRPAIEDLAARADDPTGRKSLERAVRDLERPQPREAPPAFNIWEEFPEVEPPAFELLGVEDQAKFLDSPLAEHRRGVLEAMLPDDVSPALFARVLDAARADEDTSVRVAAWGLLEEWADRQEVRDAAWQRVRDPDADPQDRAGALQMLANVPEPSVHAAIREFYDHLPARAQVLKAMVWTRDDRYVPFIDKHLQDPDIAVCREAIVGVGLMGLNRHRSRLPEFFAVEGLREYALVAYSRLAVSEELTPRRARQQFRLLDKLAGGLDDDEVDLVGYIFDEALGDLGYDAMFDDHSGEEAHAPDPPVTPAMPKTGRNDPCPCGSGKKFKKCCGQ